MIGDWGVHICGPANGALQLGSPESVECDHVYGFNPVTYPHYSVKIHFPERPNKNIPEGKMPIVIIHWYAGNTTKRFTSPTGFTPEDCKGCNEIFVGSEAFISTS